MLSLSASFAATFAAWRAALIACAFAVFGIHGDLHACGHFATAWLVSRVISSVMILLLLYLTVCMGCPTWLCLEACLDSLSALTLPHARTCSAPVSNCCHSDGFHCLSSRECWQRPAMSSSPPHIAIANPFLSVVTLLQFVTLFDNA